MTAILQMKSVFFSYDKNDFIRNLSLSLSNGEFTGLIGPNGSGKSTILKLLAGILTPSAGEISLWGKLIRSYKGKDRAKLTSYLPQMLDLHVPFTVREIVGMGLYPYDIPPSLSPEEAMDMVGLGNQANTPVNELSGGEQRRVFIAMTLLQGSGAILLDEPLANLDITYQLELLKLLRELKDKRNVSIVTALHDINMAFHFDSVSVIRQGAIVASGHPRDVITGKLLRDVFSVKATTYVQPDGVTTVGYQI